MLACPLAAEYPDGGTSPLVFYDDRFVRGMCDELEGSFWSLSRGCEFS